LLILASGYRKRWMLSLADGRSTDAGGSGSALAALRRRARAAMPLNRRFARTGGSRGLDRLVSVLTPQNFLYEIEYFLAKVRSLNAQKEPNQAMSLLGGRSRGFALQIAFVMIGVVECLSHSVPTSANRGPSSDDENGGALSMERL
jgi:hypothetical protein